ncbi:MAG TPA: tetratricopeptide repeat protein [Candidatus Xenobia bacterium]|nr:tetratricopeptide repeat protein [Candidatus Xenobia bacterium]
MVAKSPDAKRARNDYAEGWLAINRLIRSDGSWSGRERNVFYLNLGDGRFLDLSGVAGLDFPQDGRSFALLDLDGDGDRDMILKNRNAPQLRVLRNDVPAGNHSIAFRLIGRPESSSGAYRTTRDAVGAGLTLETPQGKHTKYVTLGSGFLSESSRDLVFGLGPHSEQLRATVRWPDGKVETFEGLPADHRITIVEGASRFDAVPFKRRNSDLRACAPQQPLPANSPREGVALASPVPPPPFSLPDPKGNQWTEKDLVGRPTVINFWATWCAPCQEEMKAWKQNYAAIQAAGGELVAISVDDPQDGPKVAQFVQERALAFPVLHADPETLQRYNIFYRQLFERRTDLQVPTTFLLDASGRVIKLYRGIVPVPILLADLRDVGTAPEKIFASALPYPGRHLAGKPFRDYYPMGAAFYERGFLSDAANYLELAVVANPQDNQSLDSLGVVWAKQDRLDQALTAFQRATAIQPDYAEGYFNLGNAYLKAGDSAQAERAFARAAELDPADPEKLLHYSSVLAQNGKNELAATVMERYLKLQPDDFEGYTQLGILHAKLGSLSRATEEFLRAISLNSEYPDAYRNLGIAYLAQEMPYRAAETLERAVALKPQDASSWFALADAYLRLGRQADAAQTLERVLELDPNHSQAAEALRRLRQPGT